MVVKQWNCGSGGGGGGGEKIELWSWWRKQKNCGGDGETIELWWWNNRVVAVVEKCETFHFLSI